ncbi:carboxypeptidase-like regulatory domain-containing protein [Mesonia aquimarina]|uniref:carboxypeptidase-like regulatory domain-containing protein n=1 Tax=Mesonia aquimarina TaxID=1504967 RepID=UPI000EF57E4A|nr:carboxypeptidase-like regulatory domain-containing protein [Mesonia aquimarina]
MLKNYTLLIFLIFSFFQISAQDLSGTIFSKENKKSISYASIEIGKNYGVTTDNNGKFQINVNQFSSKDSLQFSSLGYQTKRIAVKDFQQDTVIYLKNKVNKLDEAFLVDHKLSPEEIIKRVKENINKNYMLDSLNMKITKKSTKNYNFNEFDLKLKKINLIEKDKREQFRAAIKSIVQEINDNEHVLEKENSFYYKQLPNSKPKFKNIDKDYHVTKHNPSDVASWYYALDNVIKDYIDINKEYQTKSGVIPFDRDYELQIDSTNVYFPLSWPRKKVLNPEKHDFLTNSDNYTFTIESNVEYKGDWCYKIKFVPRKSKAKLTGQLYISASDYGILKGEYQLAEGKKISSVNLKFPLGAKMQENIFSGNFIYTKKASGKYTPEFYSTKTGEYNYLKRDYRIKYKDGNWLTPSKKVTTTLLIDGQKTLDNQYYFSPLENQDSINQ